MKLNVRLLCRTALLLALCIASQFFKNTSVYLTGSVVNAILILATLSCGFLSGAAIGVIAPLTSWWITGSPIMNAYPLVVPAVMGGNLILVALVWLFARFLAKRLPVPERRDENQFRIVLILALVAAALWASVTIAFLSSLASLLQMQSVSPLLIASLIAIAGTFLLFTCLWLLITRFPNTWTLIAGMTLGSVLKAIMMWLVIVKLILPDAAPQTVRLTFSVTQLLTALIGSVVAFLVWLPLSRALGKERS